MARIITRRTEARPAPVPRTTLPRMCARLRSTLEEDMLSRNALMVIVATALTAAVAAAQQPAKPATTHPSTAAQAPTAAKKNAATSSAAALAVNADSAKRIVLANEAGATVTSNKLHHSGGKAYYAVSYKLKGDKKTMHATVDATTGAFAAAAAPAAPAASTKSSAKKPS